MGGASENVLVSLHYESNAGAVFFDYFCSSKRCRSARPVRPSGTRCRKRHSGPVLPARARWRTAATLTRCIEGGRSTDRDRAYTTRSTSERVGRRVAATGSRSMTHEEIPAAAAEAAAARKGRVCGERGRASADRLVDAAAWLASARSASTSRAPVSTAPSSPRPGAASSRRARRRSPTTTRTRSRWRVAAAHRCLEDVDPLARRRPLLRLDLVAVPREAGRERGRDGVRSAARDLDRGLHRLGARRHRRARGGGARGAEPVRRAACSWSPSDCRPAEPEGELEGVLGDGAVAVRRRRQGAARRVRRRGRGRRGVHLPVAHATTATRVQVQDARFSMTPRLPARPRRGDRARAERARRRHRATLAALAVGSPDARAAQRPRQGGRLRREDAARAVADRRRSACSARPIRCCCSRAALEKAQARRHASSSAAFGEGAEALLLRAPATARARRACRPSRAGGDRAQAAAADLREVPQVPPHPRPGRDAGRADHQRARVARAQAGHRASTAAAAATCGMVQYPMARVCLACQAREGLEPVKLAKRGTIFTYTVDHLAANLEHPLRHGRGRSRGRRPPLPADDRLHARGGADRRPGRAHLPPPPRRRRATTTTTGRRARL